MICGITQSSPWQDCTSSRRLVRLTVQQAQRGGFGLTLVPQRLVSHVGNTACHSTPYHMRIALIRAFWRKSP